jgi:hypothetical protein
MSRVASELAGSGLPGNLARGRERVSDLAGSGLPGNLAREHSRAAGSPPAGSPLPGFLHMKTIGSNDDPAF